MFWHEKSMIDRNTKRQVTSIKHILWELLFIFSTVLIFRSIWLIMDYYFGTSALGIGLAIGIALAFLSLRQLYKFHKF